MTTETTQERLRAIVQEADALLITAGAGMGVDSGLPDFRGNEGFWNAYPHAKRLGLSFVEMANPKWFESDPSMAWAFYGHRLNLYRNTVPHEGFVRLLEPGRRKSKGYFVVTSNVDGQFQKAGFDAQRIWEVHGSIHHLQCTDLACRGIYDAGRTNIEVDMQRFRAEEPLPRCPICGGIARPNILMFGDWEWDGSRSDDQQMRYSLWLSEIRRSEARLVIVEIGAGEAVATIRHLSEGVAGYEGARLIRINPRDSRVPSGAYALETGAKEGLALLCGGSRSALS